MNETLTVFSAELEKQRARALRWYRKWYAAERRARMWEARAKTKKARR